MNPPAIEPGLENGFSCGSCDRSKDDIFILRDGSVVCADCVELWERDRSKQNWNGIMASDDTEVADHMKRHGIRPTSTPAEVIDAWDRAAHPLRDWIEWNIKRHRDEAERLRAQGFTLSEGDHGGWVRKN